MRYKIKVPTRRGSVLDGVLFKVENTDIEKADTVVIAITGIHGNFFSNPFYYNIGDTLNAAGYDFIYAQTNDAFGRIRTRNAKTGKEEVIGSWNERFAFTDDDIDAYLRFATDQGYRHIILGGHSLGANKVVRYMADHPDDARIEHFLLLSPANITHMLSPVTPQERAYIQQAMAEGREDEMLPFPLMGWVESTVGTAADWLSPTLNNAHTSPDGDFSQAEKVQHTGALVVGSYDNFTDGDPVAFLENLNSHMPTANLNEIVIIERTGHTYQQKEQEIADIITRLVQGWQQEREAI